MGWSQFPNGPHISNLMVNDVSGLNEWTSFPPNINNLDSIILLSNNLNDTGIGRILEWQLDTSANTLKTLQLDSNSLTKIPSQIKSFVNLKSVSLDNQQQGIETISTGSLAFPKSTKISSISLNNLKTQTIEPGAFEGDSN